MITYNELKLIKELWKRGWANDKAQEVIHQECVRVCKYFAKVDEAYNSYATFDIIPDLDIIKVILEIERNVTYTRYIPLRSITLPPEELYNKKTCRMLLKEGNDIWIKSQKTENKQLN